MKHWSLGVGWTVDIGRSGGVLVVYGGA